MECSYFEATRGTARADYARTMTGLRWGILATGGIAHAFTSDLRTAGLTVSAVGSRRPDASRAFADQFAIPHAHGSYEELVADPDVDIVYIATPHPMHADNAVLALEAGKHVLIEKPFTLTGPEAERVREVEFLAQRGVGTVEPAPDLFGLALAHAAQLREFTNRRAHHSFGCPERE